ncbi:MAG: GIY-YIG nuclease family protein [Rhodospirillaceae bacterium]|nr:GIY-YIG nuclease family protein [Rhodospirillaceae bacterium]MCA8931676.1 GIY-YIG nuclease family protein [Rhodospirillaceae bacterium]
MKSEEKKAAVAAYKERKATAGIYGVTCAATGQRWVGYAPDLEKIQNRLWFTLRQGGHPRRSLQEAWRQHGADGLAFAELERFEAEDLAYVRDRTAKDRLAQWRDKLGADPL